MTAHKFEHQGRATVMNKLILWLVFPLVLPGMTSASLAQGQTPAPITVEQIKGNLYLVKGGAGANTCFYVAEKEVIAIDAKMTEESAKQMLLAIRRITPLPVTKIILTHSDGDHVNGLVGFPAGVEIISHDNTRGHMVEQFESDQQLACLPTTTFSEKLTLHVGKGKDDTVIELLYFGPAHTNGDATVFFPAEKAAVIGDLLFLGRDPLIHRAKNGTSFGLVKVLNALLALEVEKYASGHNDVVSKKEIRDFVQSVTEKQSKIRDLVKAGKSLDEVKKALNIETPAGGSRWPSLAEVIYLELTGK
jgi:cyclase